MRQSMADPRGPQAGETRNEAGFRIRAECPLTLRNGQPCGVKSVQVQAPPGATSPLLSAPSAGQARPMGVPQCDARAPGQPDRRRLERAQGRWPRRPRSPAPAPRDDRCSSRAGVSSRPVKTPAYQRSSGHLAPRRVPAAARIRPYGQRDGCRPGCPQTAPFVDEQRSPPALPLLVRSASELGAHRNLATYCGRCRRRMGPGQSCEMRPMRACTRGPGGAALRGCRRIRWR
jgi:hypothetical protein